MLAISDTLRGFNVISLEKMNDVRLLNRFDSKYQFPKDKLDLMLNEIKSKYCILEINGQKIQQYKTTYFDTQNNQFYSKHHNGRLSRLKIRKREYLNSGDIFLEIKKKNNKGKTKKVRLETKNIQKELTEKELSFLNKHTNLGFHLSNNNLFVKMVNTFSRVTLVNVDFNERCTIDFNLRFNAGISEFAIADLAVVELKHNKANLKSPFSIQLKKNTIPKQGFSKYCIGRAFLEPTLKRNLFKPKILQLKKHYNGSIVLQ